MTTLADISARLRERADFTHPNPVQLDAANLMQEAATMLDIRSTPEEPWKRGDLVLVDGDKEGCVLSVNGNVAQVSMWAASAATVNLTRLSPLEVTGVEAERELTERDDRNGAEIETPWRKWAAKVLSAYPWVDEFKSEDSDEKYRDGVRYVLLCVECNGSGSEDDNREMREIRERWGFA